MAQGRGPTGHTDVVPRAGLVAGAGVGEVFATAARTVIGDRVADRVSAKREHVVFVGRGIDEGHDGLKRRRAGRQRPARHRKRIRRRPGGIDEQNVVDAVEADRVGAQSPVPVTDLDHALSYLSGTTCASWPLEANAAPLMLRMSRPQKFGTLAM